MKNPFIRINENIVKYNLVNLSNLVFEVTDTCNLNCKYCGFGNFYYGYDKREKNFLPFSKAKILIDYLVDLWNENLDKSLKQPLMIGFYGGEPLNNFKLIEEIVYYCNNLKIDCKKIQYNITTNAVLLHRYIDFLVENKFYVLISLDGDEYNHSYRLFKNGKNSHSRVIGNIELIRSKYPDYFLNYINFNTVIHNRNSVENAIYFILNNFGKIPSVSPLNNSGIKPEMVDDYRKTYQNVYLSVLNSANCNQLENDMFIKAPRINSLAFYLHRFSGNVFDSYNAFFFNKKALVIPTGTCLPFKKKMFVTVHGKILACEKITHNFSLGQIHNDRIVLDLKKIAKIHNKYIFKFEKRCKTCLFKYDCPQCVYNVDDIIHENINCPRYKSEKNSQDDIRTNLNYLSEHPEYYKKIMEEVKITQ